MWQLVLLLSLVHHSAVPNRTNQHKSPEEDRRNRDKLIGRHGEGNESLILFGSLPNNLSLTIIASLKSERGSNLNG